MRGIVDGKAQRRALILLAVSGLAVFSAAGIASAGGSASQAGDTATVTATFDPPNRLFFAPRNITIASGGRLTIENGQPIPHTISLVRESLLPKTRRQRRQCYAPGHICFRVLIWHRAADNNEQNDLDRVDVGRPGFDTVGGLRKTGDSIFFGRRSRSVIVSAPAGRTLPFMCLIHPWMQGHINVE